MSPYLALENGGLTSNPQTRKELFHVHGTFEKGIRVLSKVKSRSNPRDGVRNHRRPPGDLVSLVDRSGNNEQQNTGCDHPGLLP